MLDEFEKQNSKVDEVNDLGNALEALTNSSDRPLSPIRRVNRELIFLSIESNNTCININFHNIITYASKL